MYVILKNKTILLTQDMGFRTPHTVTTFVAYDTLEEALEHKRPNDVLLRTVDYEVTEKDVLTPQLQPNPSPDEKKGAFYPTSVDLVPSTPSPPPPPRPAPNPTTTF